MRSKFYHRAEFFEAESLLVGWIPAIKYLSRSENKKGLQQKIQSDMLLVPNLNRRWIFFQPIMYFHLYC